MLLLLLFTFAVAVIVHQFWYRRLSFPPGPTPFPLVGNLGSLWSLERWEDQFLKWKKVGGNLSLIHNLNFQEYGAIYTYWWVLIEFKKGRREKLGSEKNFG
jgi:hypothetical protein